jgi:hypothetical protein
MYIIRCSAFLVLNLLIVEKDCKLRGRVGLWEVKKNSIKIKNKVINCMLIY